jgi:hypothetical protein
MSSAAENRSQQGGTGTSAEKASESQILGPTMNRSASYHVVGEHLPREWWWHHHELEITTTLVTELHVQFLQRLRRDGVHFVKLNYSKLSLARQIKNYHPCYADFCYYACKFNNSISKS